MAAWAPGCQAGHCLQESRQGWARGTSSVCLVLVKEKFAPQGSLLALPLEHRPKGRTPLCGSLRTRSVCTRTTTHWWVMKLGY